MRNNKQTILPVRRAKQRGFSIVELMVAILIGLIILAGVVQVVISSKTTFLSQEDMAYIQENARYAIDTMSKDIQGAGYWGCAGANPLFAVVADFQDAPSPEALIDAQALMGTPLASPGHTMQPMQAVGYKSDFPESAEVWSPPATNETGAHEPESIIIRRAEGDVHSIQSHTGTTFNLDTAATDYEANDYLVVIGEDCRRVGVIRAAGVTENGGTGAQITYNDTSVCSTAVKPNVQAQPYDCNSPNGGGSYQPGSVIMGYSAIGYFIAESSVLPGQPALKRMRMPGDGSMVQEIALGVEDMAFSYGFREGDDVRYYSVDTLGATPNWSNLVAVKIDLVMRSHTQSDTTDDGQELLKNIYEDKYIRRLISTTVQLKNRT